jgi:hypothetical protein
MLPDLTAAGLLPPGVHRTTWNEFLTRFGGTPARERLLEGLQRAATNLRDAGARDLWIDGSFVTSEENPGDFDGAWDFTQVQPAEVDPILLDIHDIKNGCLKQKVKYGGQLFIESPSQSFVQFFRTTRDGDSKGIVLLNLRTLP